MTYLNQAAFFVNSFILMERRNDFIRSVKNGLLFIDSRRAWRRDGALETFLRGNPFIFHRIVCFVNLFVMEEIMLFNE